LTPNGDGYRAGVADYSAPDGAMLLMRLSMATYRIDKINVGAPPPEDILPRWRYAANVSNTANPSDKQVITFLSDDENPLSASDTCNTIEGLLGDGNNLDLNCADLET
jgi:hypothetical protein